MLGQFRGEEGPDAQCGFYGRHLSFIIRFRVLYKVMIYVFLIRLCPNVCSSSMGRMASLITLWLACGRVALPGVRFNQRCGLDGHMPFRWIS